MEIDRFEDVDDRRHQFLGEREGAESCLGSQPIWSTRLPSRLSARRLRFDAGRRFADAALAINGDDFRVADLVARIELHLHAAVSVKPAA